jgi:hypothetical protein
MLDELPDGQLRPAKPSSTRVARFTLPAGTHQPRQGQGKDRRTTR